MRSIYFYKVDENKIICVKKIHNTINFIDIETDGVNFSYTINANFSKKNIEQFLKTKFNTYEQKKARRTT
jgi:hypothetical protein